MTQDRLAKEFAKELTKLCKKFDIEIFPDRYSINLSLSWDFPDGYCYKYSKDDYLPELELVKESENE